MSEKELDAILNEIKKHSSDDDTQQSEPVASTEPQQEESDTADTDFKLSDEPEEVKDDDKALSLNEEEKENEPMQKQNNFDTNDYIDLNSVQNSGDGKKPGDSKKKVIIAVVAVIAVIAIAVGVYFGFFHNKKTEEPQTTQAPQTTQSTTAQATASSIRSPERTDIINRQSAKDRLLSL